MDFIAIDRQRNAGKRFEDQVRERAKNFVIPDGVPPPKAPERKLTFMEQARDMTPFQFDPVSGNLIPAQFNLKKDTNFLLKTSQRMFNVATAGMTGYVNRLADLFEKPKTKHPVIEKGGRAIATGAAALNLIPQWLAFSAVLQGAEEVPLVKWPAKAVNYGFQKIGEAGAWVGGKAVDVSPMPEDVKAILREPIMELGAIASQLGTAHFAKKYVEVIKKKAQERAITNADQARGAVSEAMKEVAPPKEGEMKIGDVTVKTDQKFVLENLIKGQEQLDYKIVEKFGKDVEGKQIAARFGKDPETGRWTIYATDKTTAAQLAEEIGHWVDRTTMSKIGRSFTDIILDFNKNAEEIVGKMAGYVIETSGKKKLEGIELGYQVKTLIDDINAELLNLGKDTGRNERFASAVRQVLTTPDTIISKAPKLTGLIRYMLGKKGVTGESLKQLESFTKSRAELLRETITDTTGLKVEDTRTTKTEKIYVIEGEGAGATVHVPAGEKGKVYIGNFISDTPGQGKGTVFGQKLINWIEKKYPDSKIYSLDKGTRAEAFLHRFGFNKEGAELVRSMPAREPQIQTIENGGVVPKQKGSSDVATTGLDSGRSKKNKLDWEGIAKEEDVVKELNALAKGNENFKEARRALSETEIDAMARDLKIDPDMLLENMKRRGLIVNAETLRVYKQALVDQVKRVQASMDNPQLFALEHKRLLALQEFVSSVKTEWGHLGREQQRPLSWGENATIEEVANRLKKMGFDKEADAMRALTKQREALQATFKDKLIHAYYMSILSGPTTQAKNFVGNSFNLIGEVARIATTNPGELPMALGKMYQGLLKGGEEFKRIWKEGDTSKFEEGKIAKVEFKGKASFLNNLDYVGRLMSGVDAIFRNGFKEMERAGISREIAKLEGKTGEALRKRAEEIYSSFPDERLAEVEYFGQRGVFNQSPEGVFGAISDAFSGINRKIPMMRALVPFTRIVANVVNNSLDWTFVGAKRALLTEAYFGGKQIPFTKAVLGKKGGLFGDYYKNELTPRQAHQAFARGLLGSAALLLAGTMAANNEMSGSGPRDYRKKQQLMATGWRPNSVKIGDRWYPYQTWGPLSIPFTLVSNWFDGYRYGDIKGKDAMERGSAAVLGSMNSILDMSFLSNMSDFITAIQEWNTGGPNFAKQFVAQQSTALVPNTYKQVARWFDPNVYDAQTVKEKILSNLRITSGMKPKLNVFGQEVIGESLTGLEPVKTVDDPLISWLAEKELYITVPNKTTEIWDGGSKRAMNRDEYYEYVKNSGKEIYDTLTAQLDYLKQIDDAEMREKYVDKIVSQIREKHRFLLAK